MSQILVSGLINLETTVKVDGFPIAYQPARYPFFGVNSTVSGVGYNIARALHTLGRDIQFLSMVGQDWIGQMTLDVIGQQGIKTGYILPRLQQTAQSVILYDGKGRRQINVDLKDNQETPYPAVHFEQAATDCNLAVLCNINFSRPFLAKAKSLNLTVATDVHDLADLDDDYNRDYMAGADILFLSHERLPDTPENVASQLIGKYGNAIVVIGLGSQGALLAVRDDNQVERYPAVVTRPVVNTIGAGDSLFSAFVHEFSLHQDPYLALRKAIVFASYKIGVSGAADGFLTQAELDKWVEKVSAEGSY